MEENNPAGFENFDENEFDLTVVDRNMFEGKTLAGSAKLSDVERVNLGVIRVEDGVNRTIRLLNRRVTQTNVRLTQLSAEINTSFVTVKDRVDFVEETIIALDGEIERVKAVMPGRSRPLADGTEPPRVVVPIEETDDGNAQVEQPRVDRIEDWTFNVDPDPDAVEEKYIE